MAEKKNRSTIMILGLLGVLLIGGGLFFYNLLGGEDLAIDGSDQLETDVKIERIKMLAKENFEFFVPVDDSQSLFDKLSESPQYQHLRDQEAIIINLDNIGNAYPFAASQVATFPE